MQAVDRQLILSRLLFMIMMTTILLIELI